ncbi:MAG TPA: macro domain-containing protein [Thermoanaerobaculia bacterium]|nr:macro domain-containing protein [Thermoanaerobaculia bacterium]
MNISLFVGDITDVQADAVCTSTNPRLSLMMGTGGAVRERGGFQVLRECEKLTAGHSLPPGSAYVTSGGALPFKAVIHCVASDTSHRSSPALVRLCVKNALARADASGCKTVAMPVFGSGHARVRFDQALKTMRDTLRASESAVEQVVIVVYDPDYAEDAREILKSPSA